MRMKRHNHFVIFTAFLSHFRLSFKPTNEYADVGHVGTNDGEPSWRTLDPKAFPVLWQTSNHTPLPAEATPSEMANRFHDICMKAVGLICHSDFMPSVEAPWDFTLNYSLFTLPSHFEKYKQANSCFLANSFEIFTQWTFCLWLKFLDFSLVSFSGVLNFN